MTYWMVKRTTRMAIKTEGEIGGGNGVVLLVSDWNRRFCQLSLAALLFLVLFDIVTILMCKNCRKKQTSWHRWNLNFISFENWNLFLFFDGTSIQPTRVLYFAAKSEKGVWSTAHRLAKKWKKKRKVSNSLFTSHFY